MTVLEVIRRRRSVRAYEGRAIPAQVMERMCEALRLAPSACNNQPWKFVIVTNAEIRKQLVGACRGQKYVAEAPVVIVGVGYPAQAYQHMGGYGNSTDVDIAIAFDHLTLAAAEEGLGTCWVGAFSEAEVKRVLNVPAEAKVVALIPLGYPKDPGVFDGKEKPRKAPGDIFVHEKF